MAERPMVSGLILGPVEDIGPKAPRGRFMPRGFFADCSVPDSTWNPFATADEAEAFLDQQQRAFEAAGFYVIRCRTMEQRAAILAFCHDMLESLPLRFLNRLRTHGHLEEKPKHG